MLKNISSSLIALAICLPLLIVCVRMLWVTLTDLIKTPVDDKVDNTTLAALIIYLLLTAGLIGAVVFSTIDIISYTMQYRL